MDQGSYPHLLVLTPLLLQLVGLTFAVFTDRHVHRKNKILLLIIVLMNAVLIASDYLEFIYSTSGMPAERLFASVVGYCVRPIVLLLFVYVVGEIRQYWPLWTLIGLNAAIHLTAFFSSAVTSAKVLSRGS